MARPTKSGLDYFPFDTALDDKFALVEAEYGIQGFAVVVKLFQKIYGGYGYYCEWTKEVALLFSRNIGLGCSAVSEIVEAAARRGIFNKEMLEKQGVLTSKGIQERYIDACSRRKQIFIEKRYLLLSASVLPENVYTNAVNVDINGKNADNNPQSKVKESKVKESRERKGRFVKPTVDEVRALCQENQYRVDARRFIDYYEANGWMVGKNHMKDWRAALRNWNSRERDMPRKQQKLTGAPSFDLEQIKKDTLENTDIKF